MSIQPVDRENTQTEQKWNITPEKLRTLIPIITSIGIGSYFVPNFNLGLGVGVGMFLIDCTTLGLLEKYKVVVLANESEDNIYHRTLEEFPFITDVICPIVEESLHRGFLQSLLSKKIQVIFPSTENLLIGPLSTATTTSILANSAIFGLAHYFNPHQAASLQAIFASVQGIAFGVLADQYGLGSAIGAHTAINASGTILSMLGL